MESFHARDFTKNSVPNLAYVCQVIVALHLRECFSADHLESGSKNLQNIWKGRGHAMA